MRLMVADIGGTNGRFGVASVEASGDVIVTELRSYLNADFKNLGSLLSLYLSGLSDMPTAACLAIAGPNDGRRGFMVNLDWELDADKLEQMLPLDQIQFVNDFAAQAVAVPHLPQRDLVCLHAGEAGTGCISVIGPGTGLGVAALAPAPGRYAMSAEGGHMSWAPADSRERELYDFLHARVDYLCVETVLSGPGLVRIYEFLKRAARSTQAPLSPADITARALSGSDRTCVDTVQMFLAMLGSVAGDIALVQGATAGVYLGGGIVPHIVPLLAGSDLVNRFLAKGPLSPYMEDIPLHLITAENPALTGAAALFCYS